MEPNRPHTEAACPGEEGQRTGRRFSLPAWRPWCGRPQARDLLCVAAIALSALYSAAMIPMTPLLIATHPVKLEMLAGSNASVVAAAAFTDVHGGPHPALLVAAALPAMMRSDWIMWWAGRRWGHRIVEILDRHRSGRLGSRLRDGRGKWFAVPVVALAAFMPGGTQAPIYATAGWLGLPLLPFLVADAIGTAVWVSLLAMSGYMLGPNGVSMAHLVAHYALLAISVPIVTAIAPHAWRAWRAWRPSPAAAAGGRRLSPE